MDLSYVTNTLSNLLQQTAFKNLTWGNYVMILVACVFLYLSIAKGFEPLLLTPIAFGMLLVNIYPSIMTPFVRFGRMVNPSFPDFHGCRCDDRLRSFDCQS